MAGGIVQIRVGTVILCQESNSNHQPTTIKTLMVVSGNIFCRPAWVQTLTRTNENDEILSAAQISFRRWEPPSKSPPSTYGRQVPPSSAGECPLPLKCVIIFKNQPTPVEGQGGCSLTNRGKPTTLYAHCHIYPTKCLHLSNVDVKRQNAYSSEMA